MVRHLATTLLDSDFSDEEPTLDMKYSDGVPEPVGDGGDSEKELPPPPRMSRPFDDDDPTVPMRKVKL